MKTQNQIERKQRAIRRAEALNQQADEATRGAVDMSDAKMRRAVRLTNKARSAEHAVRGSGRAILSHDPEGPEALRAKVTKLEAQRERMKAINRAFKKGGWDAVREIASDVIVEDCQHRMSACGHRRPYESYSLQNIGARIRSTKQRIQRLEEVRAEEPREIEFDGGVVELDPEAYRIRLQFDRRLTRDEARAIKREHGFRWSRANEAWQRHLNGAGKWAAKCAVQKITGQEIDI